MNSPPDTSDANSTTLFQIRRKIFLIPGPLLPRRKKSTTSLSSSIPKTKKDQSHENIGNNNTGTSSPSSQNPPVSSTRQPFELKKSQPLGSYPQNSAARSNNDIKLISQVVSFPSARDDQLSVILEYLDERSSISISGSGSGNTSNSESADPTAPRPPTPSPHRNSKPLPLPIPETIREFFPHTPTPSFKPSSKFHKIGVRERAHSSKIPNYTNHRNNPENHNNNTRPKNLVTRVENRDPSTGDLIDKVEQALSSSALGIKMASSVGDRATPDIATRPIAHPPKDLESIARIDSSLIFEHFTTNDAWVLGSALRERLLPHPTPVVISISLSNANQVLFHCCTHSGTMPDNDSWVARKRKTVLRWGVSTWYMWCKFEGDEEAFARKYGLGNDAGEYAIHGGGVPIRVTGVEGVVACVVVSGLKQWEDHGVIVEVIRDLYY